MMATGSSGPMDERSFKRLAEITSAIGASPRFSKILSDATLPAQAKIQLLNDVTKGALGESGPVVDALRTAFSTERPAAGNLADHMLSVTARAAFSVAGERLGRLENDLRMFVDLVRANNDLRFIMTDPGATDEAKKAIAGDLLAGKVDGIVIALLQTIISIHHGHNLDAEAQAIADLAAEEQGHVVADVRTAIDLDPSYQSRIAAALTTAVGKKVEPRFTTDPSIVGSVVVRVGDEVWDGSVRQRLEQARIAMTKVTNSQ